VGRRELTRALLLLLMSPVLTHAATATQAPAASGVGVEPAEEEFVPGVASD